MSHINPTSIAGYTIFTTEHDLEERAGDLLAQIDTEYPGHRQGLSDYMENFSTKFPLQEITLEPSDRPVTFLLDLSGSMRGEPAAVMVTSVLQVADALASQGRSFEILGFTTRAWRGGRSREYWLLEDRSPVAPGRLNDLRHVIFKSLSDDWETVRQDLSLVFLQGALKENIDGEALAWAANRVLDRVDQGSPEGVIVMISDGVPVDDSTLSSNPSDFLQRHLDGVIQEVAEKLPLKQIFLRDTPFTKDGDLVLEDWRSPACLTQAIITAISDGATARKPV